VVSRKTMLFVTWLGVTTLLACGVTSVWLTTPFTPGWGYAANSWGWTDIAFVTAAFEICAWQLWRFAPRRGGNNRRLP
jgi:hypothetical protein